jgi:cysteine desulfurase / selenocysteine lyase
MKSVGDHPGGSFDVARVRADFPILSTKAHGKPLVYLDNAATTQKPRAVIDAIKHYYEAQNANVHRGVYELSQVATELYEGARLKVQRFVNAGDSAEIIFTRGTTEGINLVAACWSRAFLRDGDEVLVSAMEHHSNIVPWQIACDAAGARLRVIPMNDAGELRMDEFAKLLGPRTRMVAVNHVSNSLGTINPIEEIIRQAHAFGAKVLIDGAQWVAHHPTDVRKLDADFYCFSGHKLYGPTGIGALYGKRALLEAMPPYMGGGDMIRSVTFEKTEYADLPNKFEAGTPDIAGAVGLGVAIDYVTSLGFERFMPHEEGLLQYATEQLSAVPGLRIIGTAKRKAGVISFVMEDPAISPLDLGTKLDAEGVAVRTGHHCCQPVMDRFKIGATTRASLAMYNTKADVDALVGALRKIREQGTAKTQATSGDDVVEAKYPPAAAASPAKAADELAEVFEFLGDRDARNQYILELGEKLPPVPQALKVEANRVHGCMSTVHLFGRKRGGNGDARIDFVADSDAHIVRGLIGILQKLFAGQRANDVLAFDVEGFFHRIGLEQFITVQRRSGLAGMVKRVRELAAK